MKNYFKYIVAIILIIVFVISVVPRTFQNDTFYIVALGQQIMEGGLDRVDHFSWHNSLEYRYPHWLFDVANAGIFNSYGLDGIYIFTCFCSVIFMLVLFWILFKKNNNWFLSFISTIIVSYMIKESFTGRAQVISYTLFLVEIQLIEHFIRKKNFLSCLGIAIISCIIANIHATAWIMTLVLFLPYIGEYIISLYTLKEINNRQAKKYRKKVQKLKQRGEEENKAQIAKLEEEIKHCEDFKNREIYKKERKIIVEKIDSEKWLFIPLIFAIIGAMVTPIGITPFTYYLKTSVGNTLTYINEHLPIIPATSIEFLSFSIVLIALIGFTNAKMKLSDAFLILGLYLMTLSARRNCYLMIPLCCVPVVSMINDFVNANIGIEKDKIEESSKKIISTIIGGCCFIIFAISIYNYVENCNFPYVDEKAYPTKATEFIKNNLDLKDIKLYNAYNTGSYILMQGIPVFIDSRCDLYTPEFNKGVTVFDDYMEVQYGNITIFELLEEYGMTHAVIAKDSVEYTYLKDDGRAEKLYEDDNFAVFKYNQIGTVVE